MRGRPMRGPPVSQKLISKKNWYWLMEIKPLSQYWLIHDLALSTVCMVTRIQGIEWWWIKGQSNDWPWKPTIRILWFEYLMKLVLMWCVYSNDPKWAIRGMGWCPSVDDVLIWRTLICVQTIFTLSIAAAANMVTLK